MAREDLSWGEVAERVALGLCPASSDYDEPHLVTEDETCSECGATILESQRHRLWFIVRDHDSYYAESFRGTEAQAKAEAAHYRPNNWTERGLAHAVLAPDQEDYVATAQARSSYGDGYADYIQRNTAEKLAKHGLDRREESLGALLAGNDGI